MKLSVYFGMVLGGVMMTAPVWAADWQTEVDKLREDVRVLQRQVYRGAESSTRPTAVDSSDVQIKINAYEEDFRKLNGRIDELDYNVKQLSEQLNKLNRDMEIRFKILEGRKVPDSLSAPTPSMPAVYEAPVAREAARSVVGASIQGNDLAPIAGSNTEVQPVVLPQVQDGPQPLVPEEAPVPQEAPKPLTAKEMYDSGMLAFNNGLYDEAELAFEHVLEQFPKDKLAGNAQYWLGEVYYRRDDFKKAKLAFKKGYEDYHDGYKAADSLFKLGMTLKNLKENKNACIVFTSFDSEFPKAEADLAKRVKAEATKLGCK